MMTAHSTFLIVVMERIQDAKNYWRTMIFLSIFATIFSSIVRRIRDHHTDGLLLVLQDLELGFI